MTTIVDLKRNFWICLTAVWYTAVAIKQTPKMELGCIRFRFLETIVRKAAEDGRNGSTSYFADEPIGNQRSILRSAPYILEERISLGCSLLFGQEKLSAPRLMADDVGPCVFPAIQTNDPEFGQIDRSPPM